MNMNENYVSLDDAVEMKGKCMFSPFSISHLNGFLVKGEIAISNSTENVTENGGSSMALN